MRALRRAVKWAEVKDALTAGQTVGTRAAEKVGERVGHLVSVSAEQMVASRVDT